MSSAMRVRLGVETDCEQVAAMCHALWPDATAAEHGAEIALTLAGTPPTTLPLVVFVAEAPSGDLVGFIEVDLRSHADGCDPKQPVGFVEGWFVREEYRRQGIAALLLHAAEAWARQQGCIEMASDTWIDHEVSQQVHEALKFEVVDRCVHYRKSL